MTVPFDNKCFLKNKIDKLSPMTRRVACLVGKIRDGL